MAHGVAVTGHGAGGVVVSSYRPTPPPPPHPLPPLLLLNNPSVISFPPGGGTFSLNRSHAAGAVQDEYIIGALTIYLDVINLFVYIMRLVGGGDR